MTQPIRENLSKPLERALNMSSWKVVRLKRAKTRKVAKIYTTHHPKACKFNVRSYIFPRLRRITLKLGKLTNSTALFLVVSTNFP